MHFTPPKGPDGVPGRQYKERQGGKKELMWRNGKTDEEKEKRDSVSPSPFRGAH